MTIVDIFRAVAREHASKAAIFEHGQSLTYDELNARSDALAAYLRGRFQGGTPVVGCVKSSMTTTLVVGLAGLKAGVGFTILDMRDSLERIRQVFDTANCALVITDCDEAEALARDLEWPTMPLASVKRPDGVLLPTPQADTLCYIEPTSGSTGRPKLVPIDQATLLHYTLQQRDLGNITHRDVVALLGEMWFDSLFSGLIAGATLAAYDLRGAGVSVLPAWMAKQRVSVIQTFVAAFRALADSAQDPLPDLRVVKLAGEVVMGSDVDAFERVCGANAQLINYYGSTECSLMTAYCHAHGQTRPDGPGLPVGRPVEGTRVRLIDDEGRELPPGTTGQLIVQARHMSPGYLNAPAQTEGVYAQEADGTRSLATGDLAMVNPDGDLVIVGRMDDQVKIRGYSVRYAAVEEVLSQRADLEVVAVTSVLSPQGSRQLVCHYVPKPGQAPSVKHLRDRMRATVPAYMVPSYFMAHKALPRTDTGKILRRALPSPFDAADQDATAASLADTQTEAYVAATWESILGHRAFSRDDDFFDIGGDSLQAMAMVLRLERHFPVRIGYESLIMKGATIEYLAERIDRGLVLDKAPATELLKPGGDKTPLYLLPVENGEFSDWLYMLNAAAPVRDFVGLHVRDITQRAYFPQMTAQDLGEHAAQALLAVNPDGPFVLAGYSAGTQAAIETARALQAMGKQVSGLILLDPLITERDPNHGSWAWRRILSPLFKRGALLTTLNRAGHILFGRPSFELEIADETIYWSYEPKPLTGVPIVLGRALDGQDDLDGYTAYWSALLGSDVEIWDLPGYHNRITRDPFAAPLAAKVEEWMRAQADLKHGCKKEVNALHFPVADPADAI